ncbi:MAG: DNA translocase FtsK 4TM domain-containing protein, partial [Alphaproteobacteria bacterium]
MATSSSRARSATVFPEGTGTFFRRRLIELGGIAIIALGLALALALLTFHADDPSLNVATDRAARNLIGLPGAYVADFLLQALGAAAFLFAITIIVWGVRISRHCGLRRTWLRITLLPIAVLACAFALATIEKPDSWPLQSGLGGFAGEIGVKRLAQMAANAGIEGGFWLPSLVTGLLGLAAFAVSLGFSPDEWRAAGRAIGRGMVLSQRQAARGGAIAIKAGAAGGRFLGRRIRDARGSDRARIEPTMSAKGTRRQRVAEVEEDEIDSEEIDGDETSSDELTDRLPPVAPGKLIDSPKPRRERRGRGRQTALDLKSDGEARLPSLELLQEPDKDSDDPDVDETALAGNARLLESVLNDFGVNGRIIKVRPGPVVTLYELEPAPGTKTSRVIGLADDIARSMSAVSVRIAVIPGRNVIGIELPNRERRMVLLRELLLHDSFGSGAHRLLLALGKDIGGAPVVVDLARMPHLLVAGTTGSGKSVALNTMILSLLYRLTPAECRFIMIDPKMLELSVYDGIPHLLAPVVTDPPKAVSALKWTVR